MYVLVKPTSAEKPYSTALATTATSSLNVIICNDISVEKRGGGVLFSSSC